MENANDFISSQLEQLNPESSYFESEKISVSVD
jgi:hypothetical protein